jgi:transmembrane sensor
MKASPEIVREAARWTALLDTDGVPRRQRAAFEAWCAQNPLHRQVFEHMRAFGQRIETMGASERRVLTRLDRVRQRRRARQRNTLLSVAALAAAGWWASQNFSLRQFWPDYQTAHGERRTLALDDGSAVVLDADSAVSIDLGTDARRVDLFHGRLFTTVARDPRRPFVVETAEGTATALGTAFAVTRGEAGTEVEVTESRVRACPARQGECLDLEVGERALINDTGVSRLPSAQRAPSWTTGWLEVDDRPLPEVLAELNRYSRRSIRIDSSLLANLRITGSYPLDDSERALAALAVHLDLEIEATPDGTLLLKPRRP